MVESEDTLALILEKLEVLNCFVMERVDLQAWERSAVLSRLESNFAERSQNVLEDLKAHAREQSDGVKSDFIHIIYKIEYKEVSLSKLGIGFSYTDPVMGVRLV